MIEVRDSSFSRNEKNVKLKISIMYGVPDFIVPIISLKLLRYGIFDFLEKIQGWERNMFLITIKYEERQN
jgi:hypothetical protein